MYAIINALGNRVEERGARHGEELVVEVEERLVASFVHRAFQCLAGWENNIFRKEIERGLRRFAGFLRICSEERDFALMAKSFEPFLEICHLFDTPRAGIAESGFIVGVDQSRGVGMQALDAARGKGRVAGGCRDGDAARDVAVRARGNGGAVDTYGCAHAVGKFHSSVVSGH